MMVSWTGKVIFTLSPFAPENLMLRDWFGVSSRVNPLKSSQLGRIWCSSHGLLSFLPLSVTAFLYTVVNRHRVRPDFIGSRNLLTDGVHRRESASPGPVVLKVARATGAAFLGNPIDQ